MFGAPFLCEFCFHFMSFYVGFLSLSSEFFRSFLFLSLFSIFIASLPEDAKRNNLYIYFYLCCNRWSALSMSTKPNIRLAPSPYPRCLSFSIRLGEGHNELSPCHLSVLHEKSYINIITLASWKFQAKGRLTLPISTTISNLINSASLGKDLRNASLLKKTRGINGVGKSLSFIHLFHPNVTPPWDLG